MHGDDEVLLARPILVAGVGKRGGCTWSHCLKTLQLISRCLSRICTYSGLLSKTLTLVLKDALSLSLPRHLGRRRAVEELRIQAWPRGQLIDR